MAEEPSSAKWRKKKGVEAKTLRRNLTEAERILWRRLRGRSLGGWKFRRQHPIGSYVADFACVEAYLIVELDGGQHADRIDRDDRRTQDLERQGFRVMRFWNNDVLANEAGVLETIRLALPSPAAAGEGGDPARSDGEGEGQRSARTSSPSSRLSPGRHPDPLPQSGRGSGASLAAALDRLERLHPKAIDLSLGRIERLLARLGHPERRLPPVVHVAGTNGKGSTIAYMRAALEAAGARCHVYTSPHLVRFNERIRLAGELIGDDELAARLDAVERANAGDPITFFEVTTAAAFLAFAETPADWLLLEVGLGGRLDATNVVERPRLCAITPISLDHQHFLGNTVAAIAAEKAGILKPGIPAVVAPQTAEAMAAIRRRAAELGALLAPGEAPFPLPEPALPGEHQRINAALAAACLRQLGAPEAAIRRGVAGAQWPARLQRLTRGPLVEALPPDVELWLDGGHNPAAGEALAATLAGWPRRPLRLVWGMLSSKDPAGFLAPFRPLAPEVRCVPAPGAAALPPERLVRIACELGFAASAATDPAAALDAVAPGERVLICGSLYLAGQVLAANG